MKEEMNRILTMVQDGKITAQQGEQLLEAMGAYDQPVPAREQSGRRARRLCVRVKGDDSNVNVTLPLSMAKAGLALAMTTVADGKAGGVDLGEISKLVDEMAESGEVGEIVNLNSAENSVHIYME